MHTDVATIPRRANKYARQRSRAVIPCNKSRREQSKKIHWRTDFANSSESTVGKITTPGSSVRVKGSSSLLHAAFLGQYGDPRITVFPTMQKAASGASRCRGLQRGGVAGRTDWTPVNNPHSAVHSVHLWLLMNPNAIMHTTTRKKSLGPNTWGQEPSVRSPVTSSLHTEGLCPGSLRLCHRPLHVRLCARTRGYVSVCMLLGQRVVQTPVYQPGGTLLPRTQGSGKLPRQALR